MANKLKFLVTAHIRVSGKPVKKGSIMEFDPKDKADKEVMGHLHAACRLADCTDANLTLMKSELAAEKAEADAIDAETEARKKPADPKK